MSSVSSGSHSKHGLGLGWFLKESSLPRIASMVVPRFSTWRGWVAQNEIHNINSWLSWCFRMISNSFKFYHIFSSFLQGWSPIATYMFFSEGLKPHQNYLLTLCIEIIEEQSFYLKLLDHFDPTYSKCRVIADPNGWGEELEAKLRQQLQVATAVCLMCIVYLL